VKKAAGGGAEVTDTGEEDGPTSGGLGGILVRARFRTEKKRLVRSQRIRERSSLSFFHKGLLVFADQLQFYTLVLVNYTSTMEKY